MSTFCTELASIWHREIPLSAAMGLEIADYAGDELVVRAPLAPNVNLHGTVFAGSLYSVCALTGWGAIWLMLRPRGLDAHIVLADGRIRYRRAVAEDIVCRCRFDSAAQAVNLEQLERTGAAPFPLVCTVEAGGRRAVSFDGAYAVKRSPDRAGGR